MHMVVVYGDKKEQIVFSVGSSGAMYNDFTVLRKVILRCEGVWTMIRKFMREIFNCKWILPNLQLSWKPGHCL